MKKVKFCKRCERMSLHRTTKSPYCESCENFIGMEKEAAEKQLHGLVAIYECATCGTKITIDREIVLDDCRGSIKIPSPRRCSCGNRVRFDLLDIIMGKKLGVKKN